MIDFTTIERDLVPIIRLITGLPSGKVIRGNPNEFAPDGEYCALSVQSASQQGQANISQELTGPYEITETVKAQVVLRVTINFYRGRAKQLASTLFDADKRYPVLVALREAGFGWKRTGPTQNMTEVINGKVEPRAIIELYITVEDSISDIIAQADNVDLSITTDSGATIEGNTNGVSG